MDPGQIIAQRYRLDRKLGEGGMGTVYQAEHVITGRQLAVKILERRDNLAPEAVKDTHLAGGTITSKLTRAPGNNAPIGGLKVVSASGWFAARPSGTENLYKIYAESFQSAAHLNSILAEAQQIVDSALKS